MGPGVRVKWGVCILLDLNGKVGFEASPLTRRKKTTAAAGTWFFFPLLPPALGLYTELNIDLDVNVSTRVRGILENVSGKQKLFGLS